MHPNKTLSTALLAALLGVCTSSHADLLIDAGAGSNQQTFLTGDYVAGTEFTLSGSMTIDGLGWLDAEGDGLTVAHRIGLWTSTGTLLAEASVSNSSTRLASAHGTAQWFVTEIADLLLGPGTYRVAGTVNGDNIALSNDKIGNGVTLSSGYVRTDFPSGGFGNPNLTFSSQAIRATVTSGAFNNHVPEPTSAVLAGLGLLSNGQAQARNLKGKV